MRSRRHQLTELQLAFNYLLELHTAIYPAACATALPRRLGAAGAADVGAATKASAAFSSARPPGCGIICPSMEGLPLHMASYNSLSWEPMGDTGDTPKPSMFFWGDFL